MTPCQDDVSRQFNDNEKQGGTGKAHPSGQKEGLPAGSYEDAAEGPALLILNREDKKSGGIPGPRRFIGRFSKAT